jgi:hypothetical protein
MRAVMEGVAEAAVVEVMSRGGIRLRCGWQIGAGKQLVFVVRADLPALHGRVVRHNGDDLAIFLQSTVNLDAIDCIMTAMDKITPRPRLPDESVLHCAGAKDRCCPVIAA